MTTKKLRQIEKHIRLIKQQLQTIGPMRPGSLTQQYRIPKDRIGPYYQISYTYQMKSRTEYVRPRFVSELKRQIATHKRFKTLMEKWISLALQHSQLRIHLAKKSG
jgi:hypothetical protein